MRDILRTRIRAAIFMKLLLIMVQLIGLLVDSGAQSVTPFPPKTVTTLGKAASTVTNEEQLLDRIIRQCERTIRLYPDGDFTPTVMFQLSELLVKKAKFQFDRDMKRFEEQLAKFDKGLLPEEPPEPRINYKPSIALCQKILNKYHKIDFKENVLYWLGLCLFEDGDRKSATKIFLDLIQQYPQSNYRDEVNFRCGEYYFDAQEYEKAIETYRQAIEKWNNPFFAMALYKLAWSYYKLEDYPQAISTFFYLLGDIDLLDTLKCEELGRTKVELKEESISYIAMCFSEYGGIELAKTFLQDMKCSEEYAIKILYRLANVYKSRCFYQQALDILYDLLKIYPFHSQAPEIQYSIFECYEKQKLMDEAYKARKALMDNYGQGSRWFALNKDINVRNKVPILIGQIDSTLATPLIEQAHYLVSRGDTSAAVSAYQKFAELFPKDKRACKASFMAAECFYEMKEFQAAAEEYKRVMFNYPANELTETAAYHRVICYDQLLQHEKDPRPDTLILTRDKRKIHIPVNSTSQKNLIMACNDYLRVAPRGEKIPQILLKLSEHFLKLERYDIARTFLTKVLRDMAKYQRGREYFTQAASMMAQTHYKQQKYDYAEAWYSALAKGAKDSLELVEKSKKMMASSRYKMAESLLAKGDSLKAAREFERVALRYGDSEVAEVATFEAATQYQKTGNWDKAVTLFELFIQKYPHSEYIEQALLQAGLLREKLGHWLLAAENYRKLVGLNRSSKAAPEALFNAGICYENAQNWVSAAYTFEQYYTHFPENPDKVLEAMFRVGNAYFQQQKYLPARNAFQKMLTHHALLKQKNQAVDDYFAAQARFLLGEIDHQEFISIALVPPFDINLKRKQKAFNQMLENYLEASKFEIADWTTAAFYKIGLAFEEFGQAFIDSPAPSGLSEADLRTYKSTIEEKYVLPFKNKALEYYKANEKLATENSLNNSWIDKSRQRLTTLTHQLAVLNGTNQKVLDAVEN